MSVASKSFSYGPHAVTIDTGEIARQAEGAVRVRVGDTVVLVTACAQQTPTPGRDFFPLTVNYIEKTYAAGRIPGGFFKREGRPTEKETLTSRLIDRPIRPLFPDGFHNDVQVVATVLSMDPDIDADVPALLGASAALALSGIPFSGPIGAARVGWKDGRYLLNPTASELSESQLHLVVAGTEHAVLMVESEAKGLSEEVMLGAVVFGHEQMQVAIRAIKELAAQLGKPRWSWQPPVENPELTSAVTLHAQAALAQAYSITEKQQRHARLGEIKTQTLAKLAGDEQAKWSAEQVESVLFKLESNIVRQRILNGEPRIDGRDTRTVRPITVKVGVMPRTHEASFERGILGRDGRVRDFAALLRKRIVVLRPEPGGTKHLPFSYDKLTAKQLSDMGIFGVTPDYIRKLSEKGYNNVPVEKLLQLRQMNADKVLFK